MPNVNDLAAKGQFSMDPFAFVSDPAAKQKLIEELAVSYLLPEEVENEDFPLTDIFAAAKMPPEGPKAQASFGAGPSLGQTANPQMIQQQFTGAAQPPRQPIPRLGQLIGGGR